MKSGLQPASIRNGRPAPRSPEANIVINHDTPLPFNPSHLINPAFMKPFHKKRFEDSHPVITDEFR